MRMPIFEYLIPPLIEMPNNVDTLMRFEPG